MNLTATGDATYSVCLPPKNSMFFEFPFRGEGEGPTKFGNDFLFYLDIELCTRSLGWLLKTHLKIGPSELINMGSPSVVFYTYYIPHRRTV